MKYKIELKINAGLEKVIELYDNLDNLKKWQPELLSIQHIDGPLGEAGARYKLKHQIGKQKIEMIETVTSKNLPKDMSMVYQARGVWNKVENSFEKLDNTTTKWKFKSEFKFTGILIVMAILMPFLFKRESLKHMKQFKVFVESQ